MQITELIKEYSKKPQTAVSLYQMVHYGEAKSREMLFKGSLFLRREIPTRLAHRVKDLMHDLPKELSEQPSVKKVSEHYRQSFVDLVNMPNIDGDAVSCANELYSGVLNVELPKSPEVIDEYNHSFARVLQRVKDRHNNIVQEMAEGIIEWRECNKSAQPLSEQIQSFLERFYMSRIGIRCLMGHHLAVHDQQYGLEKNGKDWIGVICKKTDVVQVAKHAVNSALSVYEQHYGPFSAPRITFHTSSRSTEANHSPSIRYIPSHLHHIIFELTKNSLRATRESHADGSLPDIKIIIGEGSEDVTVKVSDEGGGIARSVEPLIWTFMYTTALRSKEKIEDDVYDRERFGGAMAAVPLAGYGYGLPLSRLYARYFGGDLKLISIEGYGTDAYLHLSRLSDSQEPLIN